MAKDSHDPYAISHQPLAMTGLYRGTWAPPRASASASQTAPTAGSSCRI
jgi:hypothetical protein